ncbi:uncharacterized protein LOC128234518 [Mya arenaria]|uniref:uncharacterized protein LOC128234518 n=1 Tax=Mya arenaria TaxID=6604 RepID=UPI0022DF6A9C|nr:uncharacterized protein LOC128234518 [Mya arenaria]
MTTIRLILVAVIFSDVGCIPPPVPEGLEWDPVSVVIPLNSTDNYSSLQRLLRASYKTRYVSKNAINHNDPGGYRIRVDATTYVSDHALDTGAEIIHRMTSHMSSTTFNRLASHATVGIFTSWEHITIFPEYYSVANPAGCCEQDHTCCAGQCRTSCTFDGRKYFKLAGAGGQRTGILDDNILCNSADPYHGRANILVHEFAHTVKLHGLDGWMHTRITNAFNAAKGNHAWAPGQYAMQTEEEYFAVGSSVFMNADRLGPDTNVHGGLQINTCGSTACSTEYAGKTNIYNHDITLYSILIEVYGNNQDITYNLSPCVRI